MKKILIVNNNLKIGGIQTALINLLHYIYKEYKIHLFLFNKDTINISKIPLNIKIIEAKFPLKLLGISHNESKNYGVKIILQSLYYRTIARLFSRKKSFDALLQNTESLNENYDVAISFMQDTTEKSFYGGCNDFVLKKVNALQKISFIHSDFSLYGGNNKLNIEILNKFDKICLVSESCKKVFDKLVPKLSNKSNVVHNFSNKEFIISSSLKETVSFSNDRINLITCSRLSSEKGLKRLINVIKQIIEYGENGFQLHIIGNGKEKQSLIEQTKNLGLEKFIIFYGEKSNPYPYMKAADLLIISSYNEAAPMVIDEAKILGIPILSTETCSSKEMLEDYGGIICENSEQGLYESILNFLKKGKKDIELLTKNYNFSNEKALREIKKVIE